MGLVKVFSFTRGITQVFLGLIKGKFGYFKKNLKFILKISHVDKIRSIRCKVGVLRASKSSRIRSIRCKEGRPCVSNKS